MSGLATPSAALVDRGGALSPELLSSRQHPRILTTVNASDLHTSFQPVVEEADSLTSNSQVWRLECTGGMATAHHAPTTRQRKAGRFLSAPPHSERGIRTVLRRVSAL
eukprot:7378644-Prymnesium_polylepis.3